MRDHAIEKAAIFIHGHGLGDDVVLAAAQVFVGDPRLDKNALAGDRVKLEETVGKKVALKDEPVNME